MMGAYMANDNTHAKKRQALVLAAAVIAVLCILRIFAPAFYSFSNISNILEQVGLIGILSGGVAFVLVGGGFDLSAAANLCLSAVSGALVMKNTGSTILGIVVIFAVALSVGLLNGISAGYLGMVPFIVTLSSMTIAEGIGILLSQSKSVVGIPQSFIKVFSAKILGIPLMVYVLLVISTLYWLLLNRSSFGRKIIATGSNEHTAVICGINVRRIRLTTYLISAVSSAIAAIFLTARLGCATMQMAGSGTGMDVLCSAILGGVSLSGGRGNMWGVFLGSCLMVTYNNIINLTGMDYFTSQVLKGILILLITWFDAKRAK